MDAAKLGAPSIKSADMSDEMQDAILEIAKEAYEKSEVEKGGVEKDIAAYIKRECDKRFGSPWHVIVGRSFGSYVTHEVGHFIYFYNRHLAHLVFKSG
ncbi:Dynein light chain [Coemansia javaensis]|uniref:Dynein light chain n=1 Tax=Coemansia javaensis TaxID=2761396 RepID=A0A9W8HI03_9FUNG|nr:Dynein light chain [Coemansia javaensis]